MTFFYLSKLYDVECLMILNNRFKRIKKDVLMVYLKVLSQHLNGGIKDYHDIQFPDTDSNAGPLG
jgi:hypothetical protein